MGKTKRNVIIAELLSSPFSTSIYQSIINSGKLSLLNSNKQLELSTYYSLIESLAYSTKYLMEEGNFGNQMIGGPIYVQIDFENQNRIRDIFTINKKILPLC